jgi:hypothetical protein
MNAPFILRFQEPCFDAQDMGVATGTTTITAVRAEAIDADPDKDRFGMLAQLTVSAGTQTCTRVRAEEADEDPDARRLCAIPLDANPSLGTQTMTNVRAEGMDEDPGGGRLRVMPTPCSSS